MFIFKILAGIFLFPGNIVLGMLNISEAQDEGMFRSMINMLFWGFIVVIAAMPWMFKSIAV